MIFGKQKLEKNESWTVRLYPLKYPTLVWLCLQDKLKRSILRKSVNLNLFNQTVFIS